MQKQNVFYESVFSSLIQTLNTIFRDERSKGHERSKRTKGIERRKGPERGERNEGVERRKGNEGLVFSFLSTSNISYKIIVNFATK